LCNETEENLAMGSFNYLNETLEQLKKANLFRSLRCIDSVQGCVVRIEGSEKIVFCSNNYLGLANHPRLIKAVLEAARQYGYGAAASRLISGTMRPHIEVEEHLANFLCKEAALVFPAGWMANEAVIRTIPQKGDIVLLDKADHASIIDAARGGEAEFRTYRRDRPEKLEKLLGEKKYRHKFIITESIFSMDGDAADLQALIELKNKYGAFLIVDEAHAFGCLGKSGAGMAEELGLLEQIDIVVVTMSKALGTSGGVVAGEKKVIEFLINKARSFIYTTSPSPVNCAAAIAALDIIKTEPKRRSRLKENADYLRGRLARLGLNIGRSRSHIIPVIIGTEEDTLRVSDELYKKGFFIVAIRPPTVPAGTARLRISIQSEHTREQLDNLCDAFAELIAGGILPVLSSRTF
jgi:8-amino-7-oxononanoate synthase